MTPPIADTNPYTVIPIASVLIAALGFLATLFFGRRSATHDHNEELREQLHQRENDLKYCRARVQELLELTITLSKKIASPDKD